MKSFRDDTESFQKHLDAMRTFRHAHNATLSDNPALAYIPRLYAIYLSRGERLVVHLPTPDGNLIFIPIWKVPVAPGSEN